MFWIVVEISNAKTVIITRSSFRVKKPVEFKSDENRGMMRHRCGEALTFAVSDSPLRVGGEAHNARIVGGGCAGGGDGAVRGGGGGGSSARAAKHRLRSQAAARGACHTPSWSQSSPRGTSATLRRVGRNGYLTGRAAGGPGGSGLMTA